VLNLSLPDPGRRLSLPNMVFVTYTLFLAGFYFVPNAVDNYKFYIAAVFLPGLFLLPRVAHKCLSSPIWLSLLVYLSYMLASSLWSAEFSPTELWLDVRYVAYILVFILLTVYWFDRNRQLPDAIMETITLVVIAAAVVSVIAFEGQGLLAMATEDRLVGLGITDNPNPSAFVYGFFGVIALDYTRQHKGESMAFVYAAGALMILLFVLLTESNTGLLAFATACALLFLFDRRPAPPSLVVALLLAGAAAIYLAWFCGFLNTTADAGLMNRLPIWQHILDDWQAAPMFGHGYQPTLIESPDDGKPSTLNYAHSAFLSTLRDGGLVGLVLLLAVYGFAMRAALGMLLKHHRARYLSLLVFGLVCVLVDSDQMVTRPRELWIIFWLPLACLVAFEIGLLDDPSSQESSRG
jgi:O-antigen ligase